MSSESSLIIKKTSDIIAKLLILLKHKCLIQVLLNEGEQVLLVHILHIDQNEKQLYLSVNESNNGSENLSELNPEFKSEFLGAKISFHASKIENAVHNSVPAYHIPIPESLLWTEARDYHRIEIPSSSLCFCSIRINESTRVQLKIADISLVGCSLICDSPVIFQLFQPNDIFKNCRIQLGNTHEGIVSFEIRHSAIVKKNDVFEVEKIGCKFIHITHAFEDCIQKYIQDLELANRQHTSD